MHNKLRCAIIVVAFASLLSIFVPVAPADTYDLLIKNGTVYDGSGNPPVQTNIAIRDQKIAAIGTLNGDTADTIIDATGLAVAPGFINMLSHAPVSLIADSRGMSDIKQGVTLEVFGEYSQGPLTPEAGKADEAR